MLQAQLVEYIINFAVDPLEVELTIEVGHANFIFHGKPMARDAGNDEPFGIGFRRLKRRRIAVRASR